MIGIGSTVGNYQVVRKLGSGAMGAVFLAEHPMIGKRVALKVIHSDLAENEEMVSRFFNEAKAVTKIGHENIIEVIDYGQTPDGDNFIVMELLEGKALGDRLKEVPTMPVGETLQIAVQIAEGLEASHQRGIVHRDLKPDNVYLIDRAGQSNFVKILDFGLAKLTQGGGALSHKTRAGSVLGTPHYMAPEQCEGKPDIDHRVDVYALGCIMFQMLCGRVPFPGEGFGEVLVKHLREPPPLPTKLNPAIPRAVEAIILHALAKRKEFRFQSMREMAVALRDPDRWARELEGHAMPGSTNEMEAPPPVRPPTASMDRSAVMPERRDPVQKTDDVAPTMIDREVPQEVSEAMATRDNPGQGATLMLDAPVLPPMAQSVYRPEVTEPHRRVQGGRRFAIFAGVAATVMVVAAVGARVVAHTSRQVAPTAPTAPTDNETRAIVLTVQTVPSGAQVTRDGQPAGTTPVVVKLPVGTKSTSITIHKPGFVDEVRTVDPTVDPQLTVSLRAAPPPPENIEPPTTAPSKTPIAATHKQPPAEHVATRPDAERTAPRPKHPKKASIHDDDILTPSF